MKSICAHRGVWYGVQSKTWSSRNCWSRSGSQNTKRLVRGEYFCINIPSYSSLGYFDQTQVDKFVEESLKMSRFKHAHVMGLIGVCLDAGPAPFIVMPYMANGSLLQYLRRERKNLVFVEGTDDDEVTLSFN